MNINMKKYFNLIVVTAFVIAMASCNKEEYKAPVSSVVSMSGRWWTELYFDDAQDGIPVSDGLIYAYADFGGYGLTTTNTAANDVDSVLIDDLHGSWPFRIKAPVSLGSLSFTPSTVLNIQEDYLGTGETVKIIDGKILKGAARSKSGAVADSIFIEFEFSDDPGSYYIYTGHRDSGQPEDQYE
jgi:hypothetical protein